MNIATEYDRWHQNIFESEPNHADEASPWYRLILEYIGNVAGRKILEIACGRGGFSNFLAMRGALVCAADFSGVALRVAARQARAVVPNLIHANFAQADAHKLPYANGSFDAVVSCETIEHLLDPQGALIEMARVCRDGGFLYLTTPNYANAMGLYYLYARARRKRATPGGDQPIDRVFLFPQIRSIVSRAGWKIVHTDGTVHQFPLWPGHNPVRVPALESNRVLRQLLSFLALHYFVMARKG